MYINMAKDIGKTKEFAARRLITRTIIISMIRVFSRPKFPVVCLMGTQKTVNS